MNNKIAVLIPVFNGEKFLSETLDSLINQEYKDFKVFICDDGSSDGSNEVIRAYAKVLDISLVKNRKNMGISYSLSRLVSIIRKEFDVGILLGQDDMLSRNYTKEIKKYFQNTKTIFVYSVLQQIDHFGKKTNKNIAPVNIKMFGKYKTSIMLHGNYVTSPGASFRIDSFPDRAVKNTPSLLHDWAQFLWTSLDSEIKIGYKINVFYRIHGNQITKKHKVSLIDVEDLKMYFINSNPFKVFFSNLSTRSKRIFVMLYFILEGGNYHNSKVGKILKNSVTHPGIPRPSFKRNRIKLPSLNVNWSDKILLPRILLNIFLVIVSTLKFSAIISIRFVLNLKYFI